MITKKKLKISTLTYSLIFVLIFTSLLITIIHLIKLQATSSPKLQSTNQISPLPTSQISWQEAHQLMADCQIKAIFQQRNLEVTLRTKSNHIYHTTQPKINDIINLAKKYQGPCDLIETIVTE